MIPERINTFKSSYLVHDSLILKSVNCLKYIPKMALQEQEISGFGKAISIIKRSLKGKEHDYTQGRRCRYGNAKFMDCQCHQYFPLSDVDLWLWSFPRIKFNWGGNCHFHRSNHGRNLSMLSLI